MNYVKTKINFLTLHEIEIIVWCVKMIQYLVIDRSVTWMVVTNNHAHLNPQSVKL